MSNIYSKSVSQIISPLISSSYSCLPSSVWQFLLRKEKKSINTIAQTHLHPIIFNHIKLFLFRADYLANLSNFPKEFSQAMKALWKRRRKINSQKCKKNFNCQFRFRIWRENLCQKKKEKKRFLSAQFNQSLFGGIFSSNQVKRQMPLSRVRYHFFF